MAQTLYKDAAVASRPVLGLAAALILLAGGATGTMAQTTSANPETAPRVLPEKKSGPARVEGFKPARESGQSGIGAGRPNPGTIHKSRMATPPRKLWPDHIYDDGIILNNRMGVVGTIRRTKPNIRGPQGSGVGATNAALPPAPPPRSRMPDGAVPQLPGFVQAGSAVNLPPLPTLSRLTRDLTGRPTLLASPNESAASRLNAAAREVQGRTGETNLGEAQVAEVPVGPCGRPARALFWDPRNIALIRYEREFGERATVLSRDIRGNCVNGRCTIQTGERSLRPLGREEVFGPKPRALPVTAEDGPSEVDTDATWALRLLNEGFAGDAALSVLDAVTTDPTREAAGLRPADIKVSPRQARELLERAALFAARTNKPEAWLLASQVAAGMREWPKADIYLKRSERAGLTPEVGAELRAARATLRGRKP